MWNWNGYASLCVFVHPEMMLDNIQLLIQKTRPSQTTVGNINSWMDDSGWNGGPKVLDFTGGVLHDGYISCHSVSDVCTGGTIFPKAVHDKPTGSDLLVARKHVAEKGSPTIATVITAIRDNM